MFPGAAKAAPSDPTIYPIVCASPYVTIYLAYGINSVTITNTNGCTQTNALNLSQGTNSTWTYSQTIGVTTTSGSYVPANGLPISTLGSGDSFNLSQTSGNDDYVIIGSQTRQFTIHFNKQIDTLNPDPVGLGQQVTVTGNNLSSVTSLNFYNSSYDEFTVATANRTATELTFTVPLTLVDWRGVTSSTPLGTYELQFHAGKTLTLIAAPIVVSVSAEELAAQRLSESMAAARVREAEKMMARGEIEAKSRRSESISVELFARAEIAGINKENIEAVQAEINALPKEHRGYIGQILEIARKFEVVGIIASDRVISIHSKTLIEVGIIPVDSKNKEALTDLIKHLDEELRSSLAAITELIAAETAEFQARIKKQAIIVLKIKSKRSS